MALSASDPAAGVAASGTTEKASETIAQSEKAEAKPEHKVMAHAKHKAHKAHKAAKPKAEGAAAAPAPAAPAPAAPAAGAEH